MFKSEKIKEILFIVVLIIVTAGVYLNSLDGEFVFDDSRIYNNPNVQLENFSISGLVHSATRIEPTTRPVANLTFVLNYFFHGFDVRGYHLTNLFVHIAAGIILYFFLRTTFSLPVLCDKFRFPHWIAFASALIWLVHPLQTQAVS